MGPNSRLYLSLIDEVFHRKNPAGVTAHITTGYQAHDPFVDELALRRRRGLSELVLRELRDVRYDVCDVFEEGDRLAARFVVAGRRSNGTRIVVPGMSINRVEGGRLHEGWIVADYTDVADLVKPAPLPADTWTGDPLPITAAPPGDARSRLEAYRWLTQQMYEERRPDAMLEAVHPEYVGFDPFRERGTGRQGAVEFQQKIVSLYRDLRYHILEAVEAGDRLAIRYRVEGTDATGRTVVVPGISINHFEGARIRRGWVFNHYGAIT